MEEGNVDKTRRQAEGSCSRPKDNHMTAFLAQTAVAFICNIHDLLLFSSSSSCCNKKLLSARLGQNSEPLEDQGKLKSL